MTSPLRALLVDDEPPALERLQQLLRLCGDVEVVALVCSVQEAIGVLQQHPIDLVFLDERMPGGDGHTLLGQITHGVEVIFTTAHSDYAVDAFAAGVHDYLLNPVQAARLGLSLERLRHRRSSTSHVHPSHQHWPLAGSKRRRPGCAPIRALCGNSLGSGDAELHPSATAREARAHGEGPLKYWEEQLPAERFLRLDRSTIVQTSLISRCERQSRSCTLLRFGNTAEATHPGRGQHRRAPAATGHGPAAMSQRHPLQWLRSWGKQEAQALAPWQRLWLQRGSLVLALGLCALALERHHRLVRQRRDTQLHQGVELAAAQWSTLEPPPTTGPIGMKPMLLPAGSARLPRPQPEGGQRAEQRRPGGADHQPKRRFAHPAGPPRALQLGAAPLVRCSQAQSTALLAEPQTLGIYCRDQNETRLWIGVIEPITDTSEQASASGLMVLLAPLRHSNHGPAMQALMQSLERQLMAGAPGDQTIRLQGHPLWGPDQRVLNLNPKPVIGEAIAALGNDLSVALPFLLSLLGLRAGLMLQRRRNLLLQRQQQQRSQQRLRRAQRLLEEGLDTLLDRQREQALQLLSPGRGDPIDDLARKLELMAQALRNQQEAPSRSAAVQFEPMCNHQGELQRLHVIAGHRAEDCERYREAIKAWSSMPSGVRSVLGLQLDLPPALWGNPRTLQELIAMLHNDNMPAELCTIGIEGANARADAIRQHLPMWRNAGFALSWLHAGSSGSSHLATQTMGG